MYVTFDQYTAAGYSAVPAAVFPRWQLRAEQIVKKHTFDRITADNITEINRAGVCEIIDALYAQSLAVPKSGEGDGIVKSYSNQHYSETYASAEETQKATDRLIHDIVQMYFTAEQLYRGVC